MNTYIRLAAFVIVSQSLIMVSMEHHARRYPTKQQIMALKMRIQPNTITSDNPQTIITMRPHGIDLKAWFGLKNALLTHQQKVSMNTQP